MCTDRPAGYRDFPIAYHVSDNTQLYPLVLIDLRHQRNKGCIDNGVLACFTDNHSGRSKSDQERFLLP